MKYDSTCVALAVLMSCGFAGHAASQPKPSQSDAAARLFEVGKFAEAGELYAQMATKNPNDHAATLQLGRIALLSNRLEDAQKWLEKALVLQPGDDDAKVMLAEAFYRRDDFQKAAAALKRRRCRHQQADHRAVSDLERREAGELQGPDAL